MIRSLIRQNRTITLVRNFNSLSTRLLLICVLIHFAPQSLAKTEKVNELKKAAVSKTVAEPAPQLFARKIPTGVVLNTQTLFRSDQSLEPLQRGVGDNWCTTWTPDNRQMTSMDDGNWIAGTQEPFVHHRTYWISGEADNFTRSVVSGYPKFLFGNESEPGWYGYGIVSVDDTIYSMVSKVPGVTFDMPFQGVKMLKSTDNGENWYRVNKEGETRLIAPNDYAARNSTAVEDMFFWREFGITDHSREWYPFSWISFVQNGQAGTASRDGYIYIYSPEGAYSHQLLLARVKKEDIEVRDNWEYFQHWNGDTPVWTSNIQQRGNVMVFPHESSTGEDSGWYSWLPSVVWNEGLGLYIMVNGGTYTNNYNWYPISVSGSLGFWYSENPYGPWTEIYYNEHFYPDNPGNRIYQPKLSPKWISEDGEEMVLIWSDAQDGHTTNYRWNQMKINLQISDNQAPTVDAGTDQAVSSLQQSIVLGSRNQSPKISAGVKSTAVQASAIPHSTSLTGTTSDDGLPAGSTLSSQWIKLSGSGTVSFGNEAAPQTTASFDQTGTYELQLSATDSELSSSDTVMIEVSELDSDLDGVPDSIDNCPQDSNASQLNTDSDTLGNACDLDDDNDTMPDIFELANGLNPLLDDTEDDLDEDGFSNLAEYLAGSDPDDAESTPAPQWPDLQLANNSWQLISLPAKPSADSTVTSVFGDDLPIADYGVDWVLFTLKDNGEYENVGINGALETGKGYWIIQQSGAAVSLDVSQGQAVSAVQSGACHSLNGCYEVPMKSSGGVHWNLLGAPLASALEINTDTTRVQTISGLCINGCSLNAAKDADFAHNKMWRYAAESYQLIESGSSLSPWDGIWFPTLNNSANLQPKLLLPVN